MTQASGQHWAQIGESTSVGGIALLCAIDRWLGRAPFRVCLYPVVLVHWLLNRTARRASLEYLSRLQARHRVFDAPPGLRQSLRHFASFAETLLDKLLATGGRYPSGKVRMQARGHAAADRQRPGRRDRHRAHRLPGAVPGAGRRRAPDSG